MTDAHHSAGFGGKGPAHPPNGSGEDLELGEGR